MAVAIGRGCGFASGRLLGATGPRMPRSPKSHGRPFQAELGMCRPENLRRVLLHALPDGFHRIRHLGFLANGSRGDNLALCHRLLSARVTGAVCESTQSHPRRSPAHRSRRVKPFSEPSADRSEKLASLIPLPLVAPEVCSKLVLNLRHHGQEGSQESARQAVRQGRGPEARARPSRRVIVHTPRRRGVAAHAPTRSDPLRANSADPSRASSAVETRSLDPSANATDSCR
jgi:hypothetical protein